MTHPIDTTWWEQQDAAQFLAPNKDHPSRAIGTDAALELVRYGLLVEVGPGTGIDYARAFQPHVLHGTLDYVGWEVTAKFCDHLRAHYPEATWHHAPLQHLLPLSCDVIYARAVLEHQTDPLAALGVLCDAARVGLVLDWYRPPADAQSFSWCGSVPCHTLRRDAAEAVLAAHGCTLTSTHAVGGNEVWLVERVELDEPERAEPAAPEQSYEDAA